MIDTLPNNVQLFENSCLIKWEKNKDRIVNMLEESDDEEIEVVDEVEEDIQFEPYSGSDVNMLAINDAYDAWESWKPTNPSEKMIKNAIDSNEHL